MVFISPEQTMHWFAQIGSNDSLNTTGKRTNSKNRKVFVTFPFSLNFSRNIVLIFLCSKY